jgi:pilus assembly protein CpaC
MKIHPSTAKRISILGLLSAALMILAIAPRALAQDTVINASFANPPKEPIPVNVLTGQSCLVIFDRPIGRLAVSNLDTAEAALVRPDQMVVNGKTIGRARFTTWSKDDSQFLFFDVDVRANLAQIDSQVRALFPKEDIRLSQANGSVVISGNVEPKVAQQIESVVQSAGFKTVNLLVQPIVNMMQVQLQIRVAEVTRNKLQELAFTPVVQTQPGQGGYSNTGQGPYSVNAVNAGSIFGSVAPSLNLFVMSNNAFAFLRALQTQGALRALAEPNLIAMNGQQASFLAGGEIPIPIIQGGSNSSAVTILFKEYGVRLNFKPTILDEQHIRLELEPEVSSLDFGNAITFAGFVIPALRVRRAKTGIELQDGQSFGIAGLLDNNEQKSLAKIPVLSDVPILGNLFKSKSFQRNESELLFIVTAKITKPMNPDAVPQLKSVDSLKDGSPLGVETPGAKSSGSSTGSGSSTSGSGSGATGGAGATGASDAGLKDSAAPANAAPADPNRINNGAGGGETPSVSAPADKGEADTKVPAGESGHSTGSGSAGGDSTGSGSDRSSGREPSESKEPAGGKEPGENKEPASGKEPGESKQPAGGKEPENNSPPKRPAASPPAQHTTARTIESLVWRLRAPEWPSLTVQRIRE